MPRTNSTTIASDAGLIEPTAADSGSNPPMTAIVTRTITSKDSISGLVSETCEVSGRFRPDVASRKTSTSVWIAMPPMRFPVARARWPLSAADDTIASSGSEPASPRRSMPPTASPRPKRSSSTSVAFDRYSPAIHVAIPAAVKTTTISGVPHELTRQFHKPDNCATSCRRGEMERVCPFSGLGTTG